MRSYGDVAFVAGDFPVRCRPYQVSLMMGYLAHYVRIGNAGEVRFTTERLRAVLAEMAYS